MRVPERSSRVLARVAPRMRRSYLATSCSAGRCDFSSRLPASQALPKSARSRGKPINQEHLTVSHASSGSSVNLHRAVTAKEQPRNMAKLTAALCLGCASAMVYTNPTAVTARRTGVSFLPVKLQSGNSKETFAKFVARTHRERSAQRDNIKVPRHRSAAQFHICRA